MHTCVRRRHHLQNWKINYRDVHSNHAHFGFEAQNGHMENYLFPLLYLYALPEYLILLKARKKNNEKFKSILSFHWYKAIFFTHLTFFFSSSTVLLSITISWNCPNCNFAGNHLFTNTTIWSVSVTVSLSGSSRTIISNVFEWNRRSSNFCSFRNTFEAIL